VFKIFILEDNKDRIKWFRKTFKNDYIFVTDNIEEAIRHISKRRFDLIFLDRDLEKKDQHGEHLAKEMKYQKMALLTPIILHSKNPRGRRRMLRHLIKYKKKVYMMIYTELKKYSAEEIYNLAGLYNNYSRKKQIKKKRIYRCVARYKKRRIHFRVSFKARKKQL